MHHQRAHDAGPGQAGKTRFAAAEREMITKRGAEIGVPDLVHQRVSDQVQAVSGAGQSPEELHLVRAVAGGFVESAHRVKRLHGEPAVRRVCNRGAGHQRQPTFGGQDGAIGPHPGDATCGGLCTGPKSRPIRLHPARAYDVIRGRQQNYLAARHRHANIAGNIDTVSPRRVRQAHPAIPFDIGRDHGPGAVDGPVVSDNDLVIGLGCLCEYGVQLGAQHGGCITARNDHTDVHTVHNDKASKR